MNFQKLLFLQIANLAATLTGIGYAYFLYLHKSDDPFAVVNHPAQSTFLHAHILAVPLLVFAVGLIWDHHQKEQCTANYRRELTSGMMLVGLFIAMAVSGYCTQILLDDLFRKWMGYTHAILSGLWLCVYLLHWLLKTRQRYSVKT